MVISYFSMRVVSTEYTCTGHNYIGTRSSAFRRRAVIDAAVHFNKRRRAAVFDKTTQTGNLVESARNEALPAKTGVDAHQQHHVDVGDDVFEQTDGCRGTQRDGRAHTCGAYGLDSAVEMAHSLHMHVHERGAAPGHTVYPYFGLLDHKMHIERLAGHLGHGFYHRKSKRDIGYETAVHNIKMQPIGLRIIDHIDSLLKMQKVSCQQRGRYYHFFSSFSRFLNAFQRITATHSNRMPRPIHDR